MSPRTEQQYEDIRENRRSAIMQAGLEMFAKHSIETASIALIAQHAGISKGLIYNYFENKESLILAIVMDGLRKFTTLAPELNGKTMTKPEIIQYIERTFSLLENHVSYWKLYFSIVLHPAVMKMAEPHLQEAILPVVEMLTGYYTDQGVADPAAQALFLGSVLDGISLNYLVNPDLYPLQTIKEIILQKLI